jgi:multidrug efflux pump
VRYLLIYGGLAVIMGVLFFRLPTTFLPDEDRGYLFTLVETPIGATQARTIDAIARTEQYFLENEQAAITSIFTTPGFSFSGSGQNAGFGFVALKNWSERKSPQLTHRALQRRANGALSQIKDAQVFAVAPAPAVELGNVAGFDFFLKDNNGQGHAALSAARDQFLALAGKSKLLANVRSGGSADAPQLRLDIDSQKAASFGVSLDDVNETLEGAWAGRYINDFIDRGRVKRVIMQGDAQFRMTPENLGRWHVRNAAGEMVSMASFAKSHWEYAAPRLDRYNGFAAMQINGEAAPGVSSGAAMEAIERLAEQLPPGFSADFTGQSFEERAVGAQAPMLYAMSLIVVFLCLAALYESWSIPTAILLAAPLGVVGAVVATTLRGLERDVYFQVAMLTTVGLTSKNAILVVEFAKANVDQGMTLIHATLRAVRDRVRPILMTSLAFGIGVLPLVMAMGAGAGAQRAVGTGVFGGMLAGTFLGIFLIPLFFVVVWRMFYGRQRKVASADGSSALPEATAVQRA